MKSLILHEPGRLSLADSAPLPPLAPGMATARVHRIGVCGTDIHAFNGRQPFFEYPRILGHELGVEIEEIHAPSGGLKPGDRCSVEPYLNCGTCVACRQGKGNCCVNLQVLGVHADGGHREFLQVPVAKLHPSATLSFDQLALVETLAIGAHAVDRAALQKGENILVIGTGPIGLSVIQFAQASGARVIAMDVSARRLAFCRDVLGVSDCVQAGELEELTAGEWPTAVFDATGNRDSMLAAFHQVAHGGRLVFVGLFRGDITFDDPNFHKRELTLLGSRNARPQDFGRIIQLIEAGRLDTTPWITHRAAFADVPAQFPGWAAKDATVLKAMIEVG